MIIITTTTDSICNQTKGDLTGACIRYRKLVCWEQIEIYKKGGRHHTRQNVTSGNEVVYRLRKQCELTVIIIIIIIMIKIIINNNNNNNDKDNN